MSRASSPVHLSCVSIPDAEAGCCLARCRLHFPSPNIRHNFSSLLLKETSVVRLEHLKKNFSLTCSFWSCFNENTFIFSDCTITLCRVCTQTAALECDLLRDHLIFMESLMLIATLCQAVSLYAWCMDGLNNISASLLLLVHPLLMKQGDREDGERPLKVVDCVYTQIYLPPLCSFAAFPDRAPDAPCPLQPFLYTRHVCLQCWRW